MRLIHCNNVAVRYFSRLSSRGPVLCLEQRRSLRISHAEFRFPGSEKLGPSRNGRMKRYFTVILIFRNFRPISRGAPKIPRICLSHSLPNPEFPEFLVEWKAPYILLYELWCNILKILFVLIENKSSGCVQRRKSSPDRK